MKIIIDAIAASQFIGIEKSRVLIQKLASLASKADERQLKPNEIAAEQIKAVRNGALCVADNIHRAICDKKQITYQQFDYKAPKMERVLHRSGKIYTMSPYAFVWNNDRYYLIGWDEDAHELRNPRVDRITNVNILCKDTTP